MKKLWAILLTLALMLSISVPAFAAEFDDANENAWYAGAASFCKENGLISGTTSTTFSPQNITTRGILVTILHSQGCLGGKP